MENQPTPQPEPLATLALSQEVAPVVAASSVKLKPPENPAAWPKQLSSLIAEFSAHWGFILGTMYFSGFLILTAHLARFGILDFEILRARIFAAGILFVVWAGGIVGACLHASKAASSNRFHVFEAGFRVHYALLYLLAWRTAPSQLFWWESAYRLCAGALFILGLQRPKPVSSGWATLIYWLAYLLCSVLGTVAYGYQEFSALLWFTMLVVVVETFRAKPLTMSGLQQNVAIYVQMLIPLVTLFGIGIYGNIRFNYGGGQLIPAAVYSSNDYHELLPDSPTKVWIIEQANDGYYIVRSPEDRSAWFLPRSAIRAMQMQPGEPKPPSTKKAAEPKPQPAATTVESKQEPPKQPEESRLATKAEPGPASARKGEATKSISPSPAK